MGKRSLGWPVTPQLASGIAEKGGGRAAGGDDGTSSEDGGFSPSSSATAPSSPPRGTPLPRALVKVAGGVGDEEVQAAPAGVVAAGVGAAAGPNSPNVSGRRGGCTNHLGGDPRGINGPGEG